MRALTLSFFFFLKRLITRARRWCNFVRLICTIRCIVCTLRCNGCTIDWRCNGCTIGIEPALGRGEHVDRGERAIERVEALFNPHELEALERGHVSVNGALGTEAGTGGNLVPGGLESLVLAVVSIGGELGEGEIDVANAGALAIGYV